MIGKPIQNKTEFFGKSPHYVVVVIITILFLCGTSTLFFGSREAAIIIFVWGVNGVPGILTLAGIIWCLRSD